MKPSPETNYNPYTHTLSHSEPPESRTPSRSKWTVPVTLDVGLGV